MKLYLSSLSTDQASIDALLYILVLMVLEVNDNDISEFSSKLKAKSLLASDLLKQHGVYPELVKYLNRFLLTKKISTEDAMEVGRVLRSARTSFERDTTIDRERFEFLNALALSLFKDSDSAWTKIERNIRILNEHSLTAVFTNEESLEVDGLTYKEAAKKIKPLVRKLTNKADAYFLTIEEAKNARLKDPDVYAEYARYLKVLNRSIKHEIFQFVRKQRQTLVPISVVKSHLDGMGLPNNLPVGFTGGQLDELGKAYTAEGRQLDKIPVGIVQMNPKYDPATDNTYVLKGGRPVVVYRTTTFLSGNKVARHSLVQDFLKAELEHVDRWRSDLNKKGSQEQVLAAMVELLYSTSARIGGRDNQTAGEPTYGLSTLQVAHLKFLPTKIVFDYAGKKGTNQYTEYKTGTTISQKVREILKEAVTGKSPTDTVFTFKRRHMNRQMVSAYLKSIGVALTPHKFRQITGTKLAMTILSKAPFKKEKFPKQAEVEKWFKTEALKIGATLHHRNGEKITSTTAIKSYIDPTPVAQFFESLGLRRPKWLPR